VSEGGMLRRVLKFKKQEVTGGWRPLHDGSIRNPCSSSDILRVIKSRRVGYVRFYLLRGDERRILKFCSHNVRRKETTL
jgi:hypothetical protein